ncbi:MAG: Fe-S cluster assembly ATPase SufC [Candidatus Aenigmatarchaeota archaeon]|nr:MAG: Fe-S cluster assembly ATPase SufC [Candidatus Aenigmarchaeota archaeon]
MAAKKNGLVIEDLHVSVDAKEIVKGLSLTVNKGDVQAVMGPNGSGKSTLAFALMGHPKYRITRGRILFNGTDVTNAKPDERARLGLFLGFQYPSEIPGVTVANFLFTAAKARDKGLNVMNFMKDLKQKMRELNIDDAFANRYLNEGFSGGEKKRMEILQLAVLRPEIAVLDEIDSGLDIDALRIVASGIEAMRGPRTGFLIITHYKRILDYVKPDSVHVMVDGRVARTGGLELAEELEKKGYEVA